MGRLVLAEVTVGVAIVDQLELEVSELGTDPGFAVAERFQRRRTRLRGLAVRIVQGAIDERVAQVKKHLAGLGITQLSARLNDGYVSVRARAADGLATADLSFHLQVVSSGVQLRVLASAIRVHGHLPTPAPLIADRVMVALFGAGESGAGERPSARGLCDVELDLVGAVLWQLLPPNGWRLPAVSELELTHVRVARAAIEIAYGPAGTRSGELGVRPSAHHVATAHDLMHSVDEQLRHGHLEEAMRGYRGLLASSGPDQPLVLDRILALAAARPGWFFDGLELARQAIGRWPRFASAHAALASITLAQGDAREAAKHLEEVVRMASADGDDDQAALAALAAARLVRVLDPKVATQLYQLALEHDPGSTEAADSLVDRLADEQRWPELVRLMRARAAITTDGARAVQLHLRLADVLLRQLGDFGGAEHELRVARELAPEDPAVHEMAATILVANDPEAAIAAWREVARLADARGDHRTCARAWARLGDLLAARAAEADVAEASSPAEEAWRRSLELDPLQSDALVGLARAAAGRNDHALAADLYERMRGLGLPQAVSAGHELALARSLIALGRLDDARTSLRRATQAGGETAAEAHALFAEIADAALDRDHAAAELDTAIASLVELAAGHHPDSDRLYTRAAELAVARAMLFDKTRQSVAAEADWQRAHALARQVAPEIARDAARTLLARSGHDASLERRWIDAVLATRPPQAERAALLVRRADVRRRERAPDLAAALADLHEAVELCEDTPDGSVGAHTDTRRRAYQLEAQIFAQSGDQRSRAQALAALARLAERAADRVATETAAAAAWLAADEPAAALPHGARAHASMASLGSAADVPATLRREVLVTLGEAAWRQRAWPDVVRAYRGLLEDPGPELPRASTFRYRLAVAADRAGDPTIALAALRPLIDDPDATRGASPELRGQALRLFADLAERAGDLFAAATALENFAALGGEGSTTARADAVYRAGELFRRAERSDDAIRCFEAALRITDAHMPALDALEAVWRERSDLERVAVILGRKVAATSRHPGRQKPLLSRLGDLQDQLGRSDVARETHQRALEIDPMWRPSLRYITLGLRDAGQVVAAASGLAQLAGELHGDNGVDLAIVARERQIAAEALSELVVVLDAAQLDAVRAVARPALERAALDNASVGAGLARLRGEIAPPPATRGDESTASRRVGSSSGALSLRDLAARARAAGKLDDAFATLETANHVNPGDPGVLRELVELATELGDHAAAARHVTDLASQLTGAQRANALLELADLYYDKLDDAIEARATMRRAADAFGSGSRRDATLRMLATEAGSHLAWDVAVEAVLSIPLEKRTQADFASLATALLRAGRDADALASIEAATAGKRFDDGGELERQLQLEIQRKTDLARSLEDRAASTWGEEASALLEEAQQLRIAIGQPGSQPLRDIAAPSVDVPRTDTAPWPLRTKTKPGVPTRHVTPAPVGYRPRPTQPPPVDHAGSAPAAPVSETRTDAVVEAPIEPGSERSASSWRPADEAVDAAPMAAIPDDEEPSSGVPTEAVDVAPSAAPEASVAAEPDASAEVADLPDAAPPAPPSVSEPSVATSEAAVVEPAVIAHDHEVAAADADVIVSEEVSVDASDRTATILDVAELAALGPAGAYPGAPPAETSNGAAGRGASQPSPASPGSVREAFSSPTLGRIKLVSREMTRPGMGALRERTPAPAERELDAPATVFSDDDDSGAWQSVSNPKLRSGPWMPSAPTASASTSTSISTQARTTTEPGRPVAPTAARAATEPPPNGAAPQPPPRIEEAPRPSVTITGTPDETELALRLAAASADRDRLFAARRADPDDPSVLLALLAHLGDGEPALRRELLDEVVRTSHGRALAIALHELAALAREARDATRATMLWSRAYEVDPSYAAVWMPLADTLAAADDIETARELYEAVARSDDYDPARRAFAAERAEALGRDDSIVSGEIAPSGRAGVAGVADLEQARRLAEREDWPAAIAAAERAATARPTDAEPLELLEEIYLGAGNVTGASEAIGRQLLLADEPLARAQLWRRRARVYREALGRDAEAYRCLKEAHACSPADPEVAYQVRTAAMVRGEWQLAASLLYREIAAASTPRERGALHLELALIFDERLDDAAQAQANYEQALAFDPTIPAVKLPLARRYEAIGRSSDAAKLYEEAAATARAADRAGLLEAAARCRATAAEAAEPDLAAQLDRAEAAGDLDAALELAQQLWRTEPGHPAAFRTLANVHRASGDLAALTELTRVRAGRAEIPDERATAWLEVARLAEEIGSVDQAARAYDHALIEDPGHTAALDARGALAFRLADYATADLIYRDLGAGESVLGDDELALRRSIIAEQLGRDGESLQHAQAAASLAPGRRDLVTRVQELATRIGELPVALAATRQVLELIPLDDDEGQLATQFALVELLRETGQLDDAVAQLERILRDHPVHAAAIEALAQVHAARGDWSNATRYLHQLVPLAPSPSHRAERLYQLGEAVLLHVNDIDRADDVFLRASDLDPGHVPTLRRLLDVYWRADDPGGIVEVATELAGRSGRLQLATASTAIAELARRGMIDLAKLRAAAAGTPAANAL